MSRFLSFDIDPQAKVTDLFLPKNTKTDSVIEDGNTLLLCQSDYIESNKQYLYYYANALCKKYYQIKNVNQSLQTIATFATWAGLDITTNMSSTMTAKTFFFNVSKLFQIKTAMWITIFSDKGIYFVLPERLSTSKIITSYKVIGTHINEFDNETIEGDSADYVINVNKDDTVQPTLVDSTIKAQILNVDKAKNNYLYVSTGQVVNPMDYIIYNGNNYYCVSQKRDKDQFLFIFVKENKSAYTFNGSNINPFIWLDNYSTNETKTNKFWIDGRQIYRKVINFGTLPNATEGTVAHGITFGANTRIIYAYGYARNPSIPYCFTIPMVNTTANLSVKLATDNTNVIIDSVATDRRAYTECYITLEYVY